MFEIGKTQSFVVERESDSGFYLTSTDPDDTEEIFMPFKLAPHDIELQIEIKAFVYLDTQGSPIASKSIPYAQVGEYAYLKVIDVQEFGAFFDWGIEKDLLVPGNEQKEKVKKGECHIVRVCLEQGTERVFGTTKLGRWLETSEFDIEMDSKISIVPVERLEQGYRSIINKKYVGIIYHSEIFESVVLGKTYDGVVKKIREDGLVDAALQAQGVQNLFDAKEKILAVLKENGGATAVYDKSSPEAIKAMFAMSKQTFKRAVGMLYKDRLITISKDGLKLL